MKKVLGVCGSPRKNGNTDILVSRILEGAKEAGAKTESVFLNRLKIKECNGCHSCWEGKRCSKRDDMNYLYPKIAESDAIVFGTPVYWYGPTAIMKGFLDRFVYFNCPENRKMIRGKSAVLAVPFEEDDIEAAAPLITMFEKSFGYLEMKLVGKILAPGVGEKRDILKKLDLLNEAYRLGGEIAR
ncbi:MAG: flavodoxin family protein [Deltaproteobacteria bacterium]|uniref:Flavodoxin family protein n=1 Tax=Candidatus Zymogenus saltonus TaxID=2844893 RepID=A0A9D8KDJ9_9DELT|nr:flavodoxin family protein [Candidatus Zymogenus saltonus]